MKAKRIVLCVIGGVLVLDTCIAAFLSNYNLGVILPGCLGLPLGDGFPCRGVGACRCCCWAFFCPIPKRGQDGGSAGVLRGVIFWVRLCCSFWEG